MDGCGPLGALFRVVVPAAVPGIVAVAVYAFMTAWGEVLFASVMTNEHHPHPGRRPAGLLHPERRLLEPGHGRLAGRQRRRWSPDSCCSSATSSPASPPAPSSDVSPKSRRGDSPRCSTCHRSAARLRLGRGHLGLPDRGRGRRGRPRAVHLGHLLPRARGDRQRRHRRRRLRPLPPLARGHRADAAARAWTPTGSPSPGRGSCPTASARSTRPGLDFYDRLVDALLDAGITPVRHPLPLGPAAGAAGPRRLAGAGRPPSASPTYAAVVAGRLGDRVTDWATLNEPLCSAWIGHLEGRMAPG